jgi:hypothetical protein
MMYMDTLATFAPVHSHTAWAHIETDDHSPQGLDALPAFARRLGLTRAWFQDKLLHPQFEITPCKQAASLQLGTVRVDRNAYIKHCAPVFWQRVTQRGER